LKNSALASHWAIGSISRIPVHSVTIG